MVWHYQEEDHANYEVLFGNYVTLRIHEWTVSKLTDHTPEENSPLPNTWEIMCVQ